MNEKYESQLNALLQQSRATVAFKQSVLNVAGGRPADCVTATPGSPPVKVLRVLMKTLEMYPQIEISEVAITGRSTCSSYAGYLLMQPGDKRIDFEWNCHWKAEKEGMTAWYGGPDQSRAANEYGYQCFKYFQQPPVS